MEPNRSEQLLVSASLACLASGTLLVYWDILSGADVASLVGAVTAAFGATLLFGALLAVVADGV